MKFSDKLMYLRTKRGLTQTELAKLSNVSQQSISHFENGRGKPSTNNAYQIAKVLGVKVGELLDDERSVDAEDKTDVVIHDGSQNMED